METPEQVIAGKERRRGTEQSKGRRGEGEEGDVVLRWRADIACLICHLQVSAYYREAECENVYVCGQQIAAMPSFTKGDAKKINNYKKEKKKIKIKLLFLHWFSRSLGSLLLLNSCTHDAAQVFSSKISKRTFRSTAHTHK